MEKSSKLSDQVQAVKDQVADLVEEDPKLSNQFYLLRWLRASRFNVEKTVRAIRLNRKWRKENEVDQMLLREPDTAFANKFPYFNDLKGKDGRPVVYVHVGILDFPSLVKEFGREEVMRELVHRMVKIEKAVFDWDNDWNGPLEDLPTDRTKGVLFVADTENLTMRKAGSTTALQLTLEWTRLFVTYFPTHGREACIINAPSIVQIPCKLIAPVLAAVGGSVLVLPKTGTNDEKLESEVFSVISAQQLEELRVRAKQVEKYQQGTRF